MAYSTPNSKVDKIHTSSLSRPPIYHEDSTKQAHCKAEFLNSLSECKCEKFFSKVEASYNAAPHRQDQEGDFDEGNLVVRRRSMTRQQNYHQKVLLWLHTVQMSEEVPYPSRTKGSMSQR